MARRKKVPMGVTAAGKRRGVKPIKRVSPRSNKAPGAMIHMGPRSDAYGGGGTKPRRSAELSKSPKPKPGPISRRIPKSPEAHMKIGVIPGAYNPIAKTDRVPRTGYRTVGPARTNRTPK